MAMAVDQRQSQLGGLGYSQMRYPPAPQFTNPWATTGATTSAPMYPTSLAATQTPQQAQAPAVTTMSYSAAPVTSAPLGSGIGFPTEGTYEQQNSLAFQDALQRPFAFSQADTSAPSYAPTSMPQATYGYSHEHTRRPSQTIHGQTSQAQRDSFNDAVDASRGMLAMSQEITPRNIYGNPNPRASTDSYGFPSSHSAHSSISSASTYPSYYNGSVGDSSVTDYSSASEMGDMTSRTLPRPTGLGGVTLPPAPQSMMGQFSSKVSSSSQKKHKCKICDKRFTRPSSLQTHMYSHTGEKPFACDVDGCGRHFSVVSNLRRHKKVHKGEREANSGDDE